MKRTVTLLYLIITLTRWGNAQWTQVGQSVFGQSQDAWAGHSVAINSTGNIMAFGANYEPFGGLGYVEVYELNSGTWTQLGQQVSTIQSDLFGHSIAMDDSGNKFIVGAPLSSDSAYHGGIAKAYEYDNGNWVQLGNTLYGTDTAGQFGRSVTMSGDGNRIAIAAPELNDIGFIKVYEYDNGNWTQLGTTIEGKQNGGDRAGWSTALSEDGSILAIGAYGNFTIPGSVRVYQFSNGDWVQLGQDIVGENNLDAFGWSVDISADGMTVIGGGRLNSGNGNQAGHARIFHYNDTTWEQLGADLDGESSINRFGTSVSINKAGNIVAVGGPENKEIALNSGHVRMFEYINNGWVQLGADIDGEGSSEMTGHSVQLNALGSTVVIGGIGKNTNAGYVRVFNMAGVGTEEIARAQVRVFPNPTTGMLNIEGGGTYALYNLLGVPVSSGFTNKAVDLSTHPMGNYILEVDTQHGKQYHNIVLTN